MSTMVWQHKQVREPRECRIVSHNSRESHLIIAFVNPKGKRVFDRPGDDFARAARRPVRMVREKVVNQIYVKTRSFGTDLVIPVLPGFSCRAGLHQVWRSPRVSTASGSDRPWVRSRPDCPRLAWHHPPVGTTAYPETGRYRSRY